MNPHNNVTRIYAPLFFFNRFCICLYDFKLKCVNIKYRVHNLRCSLICLEPKTNASQSQYLKVALKSWTSLCSLDLTDTSPSLSDRREESVFKTLLLQSGSSVLAANVNYSAPLHRRDLDARLASSKPFTRYRGNPYLCWGPPGTMLGITRGLGA